MWSAAAACLPHVSEHTPTTMTVPTAATASRSLRARPGLPAQSISDDRSLRMEKSKFFYEVKHFCVFSTNLRLEMIAIGCRSETRVETRVETPHTCNSE